MEARLHELVEGPTRDALGMVLFTRDPEIMVFVSKEGLRFECPRIFSMDKRTGTEKIEGIAFDPKDPDRRQRRFNATFDFETNTGTLQFVE